MLYLILYTLRYAVVSLSLGSNKGMIHNTKFIALRNYKCMDSLYQVNITINFVDKFVCILYVLIEQIRLTKKQSNEKGRSDGGRISYVHLMMNVTE